MTTGVRYQRLAAAAAGEPLTLPISRTTTAAATRQRRYVALRLGGMSVTQAAHTVGVAPATARRKYEPEVTA